MSVSLADGQAQIGNTYAARYGGKGKLDDRGLYSFPLPEPAPDLIRGGRLGWG